jgi:hypothetical protein
MTEDPSPDVAVQDGRLIIGGAEVTTRHPVVHACVAEGQIVVLYDPDANPRKWGTFRNLASLDRHGAELWVAEPPTTTTGDCFVRIDSCEPLAVGSWSSFDCVIDPRSGRIVESTFTK